MDSEQLRELHRYLIKKEPQHWMCNAAAAEDAGRCMSKLFLQVISRSHCAWMMRMACRRSDKVTNRLPNNSLTKAFMQLLIN